MFKKVGLVFLLLVFLSSVFLIAVNAAEKVEIPPEVEKALNEYIEKMKAEREAQIQKAAAEREEVLKQGFFILKVGGIGLLVVLVISLIGFKGYKFLTRNEEKILKRRVRNLLERGYDKGEIKRVLVLEGHGQNKVTDVLSGFKRR